MSFNAPAERTMERGCTFIVRDTTRQPSSDSYQKIQSDLLVD